MLQVPSSCALPVYVTSSVVDHADISRLIERMYLLSDENLQRVRAKSSEVSAIFCHEEAMQVLENVAERVDTTLHRHVVQLLNLGFPRLKNFGGQNRKIGHDRERCLWND